MSVAIFPFTYLTDSHPAVHARRAVPVGLGVRDQVDLCRISESVGSEVPMTQAHQWEFSLVL